MEDLKLEDGSQAPTDPFEPHEVKYIVAPNIYRLEVLVNAFLRNPASKNFTFQGEPSVYGHEEFVQAFIKYGNLY